MGQGVFDTLSEESTDSEESNTSADTDRKEGKIPFYDKVFYTLCKITGQFFITRRLENEGTHACEIC